MAIAQKLKAFLDAAKVRYTVARHPVAYTAQEIAAAQHVPGRQLAKSVLVTTDRGPVLAVLPAVQLIDLKKLKALLGAKTLTIAKEADIKQQFPDVEVGAMSPFGQLDGVPVVLDRQLGEAEEIVFNGGSHTDTVKMRYRDFSALIRAKLGAFGRAIGGPPARKKKPRPSQKPPRANAARSTTGSRSRATKKRRR